MNAQHAAFKWMIAALLVCGLSGCDRQQVHTEKFFAFGTIVELSIRSTDLKLIRQANALVNSELIRMHRDWHAWNPGLLTTTNTQLQSRLPFTGNAEIVELIVLGQEFYRQSNGLFDPAIGKLIEDWGFHQDQPGQQQNLTDQFILTRLQNRPSISDIVVENDQLTGNHPQLQLDFGGLAKGYALDKIADQLQALGAEHFILNAGGDLVVRGQHEERNWRVGIRSPNDKNSAIRLLVNDGEGVFSSGDYERFYRDNDKHVHHIINPETGRPATAARAVTVVHSDAARADAAATALMIASPDEWLRIAAQMKILVALRYDHDGNIHTTLAMRERLEFNDPLTSAVATDKM